MDANNILDSINVIAEKLFKVVEGQVYTLLDKIVIINPNILKEDPLKYIVNENNINGIIIIANALILFYLVYYIFTQLMSLYNGNKAENVYMFIIRLVIITIIVNNSYFICRQILVLFEGLTTGVEMFGEDISKTKLSFENLKEDILSIKGFMKSDFFSVDGLIKGFISFGAVSILLNFSIRYVTIIFLIIISPFAFITLCSNLTSGIFKVWIKLFVTNMTVQIVVKLIILIPIMYKNVNNIMYKIIIVGSIYILYQINVFVKEILSKITGDAQIKNIFRRD